MQSVRSCFFMLSFTCHDVTRFNQHVTRRKIHNATGRMKAATPVTASAAGGPLHAHRATGNQACCMDEFQSAAPA
jgi:hypothetical protein